MSNFLINDCLSDAPFLRGCLQLILRRLLNGMVTKVLYFDYITLLICNMPTWWPNQRARQWFVISGKNLLHELHQLDNTRTTHVQLRQSEYLLTDLLSSFYQPPPKLECLFVCIQRRETWYHSSRCLTLPPIRVKKSQLFTWRHTTWLIAWLGMNTNLIYDVHFQE